MCIYTYICALLYVEINRCWDRCGYIDQYTHKDSCGILTPLNRNDSLLEEMCVTQKDYILICISNLSKTLSGSRINWLLMEVKFHVQCVRLTQAPATAIKEGGLLIYQMWWKIGLQFFSVYKSQASDLQILGSIRGLGRVSCGELCAGLASVWAERLHIFLAMTTPHLTSLYCRERKLSHHAPFFPFRKSASEN